VCYQNKRATLRTARWHLTFPRHQIQCSFTHIYTFFSPSRDSDPSLCNSATFPHIFHHSYQADDVAVANKLTESKSIEAIKHSTFKSLWLQCKTSEKGILTKRTRKRRRRQASNARAVILIIQREANFISG
jgi:hypothetical protein